MQPAIRAQRIDDPHALGRGGAGEPVEATLLDLVRAISEETENDREVIATVLHLLHTGRVRLVGNFRGTIPDAA